MATIQLRIPLPLVAHVRPKRRNQRQPKNHFDDLPWDELRFLLMHLDLLSAISYHQPQSIYALAKKIDMNLANLKKLVSFFERIGAIRLLENRVNGRRVKTPVLVYEKIEIDLRLHADERNTSARRILRMARTR